MTEKDNLQSGAKGIPISLNKNTIRLICCYNKQMHKASHTDQGMT